MFMKKSPKSLFAVCDCGLYFYDFARSLKKTSLICVRSGKEELRFSG